MSRSMDMMEKFEAFDEIGQAGTPEQRKSCLQFILETAVGENDHFIAVRAAMGLNNPAAVHHLAYEALRAGYPNPAMEGFGHLGDRDGQLKALLVDERFGLSSVGQSYADNMLSRNFTSAVAKDFDKWCEPFGYGEVLSFEDAHTINATFNLAESYDQAVAIGRSGLWQGYLLDRFGVSVYVVDQKRKGKGATFKPLHDLSQIDPDKSLLVADDDVETGRTTKRAIRELAKYDPLTLDLYLMHPPQGEEGSGFYSTNIPEDFDRVYHSRSFSFHNFGHALAALESKL